MASTLRARKEECERLLGVPIDASSEEIERAFGLRLQGLEPGDDAGAELRALAAERIEKLREVRDWLLGFRDTVLLLNVGLNAPEQELRRGIERTIAALRAESGGDSVGRERKLARLQALQGLLGDGDGGNRSGEQASERHGERVARPVGRADRGGGSGLGRRLLGLLAVLGGVALAGVGGVIFASGLRGGGNDFASAGATMGISGGVVLGVGLVALLAGRAVGVVGHAFAQTVGMMAAGALFVGGWHGDQLMESVAGGIDLRAFGRPAAREDGSEGLQERTDVDGLDRANASPQRSRRSTGKLIHPYPGGFRAVWAEEPAGSLGWVRLEGPRTSVLMPELPAEGYPSHGRWIYRAIDAAGTVYKMSVHELGRHVDRNVLEVFADEIENDDGVEAIFVRRISMQPYAEILELQGKRRARSQRYFRAVCFGRGDELYMFSAESELATAWHGEEQELFFSSVEAW